MIPGARLVVLGKQGAGKGTQCLRLSHHYVIPHISTGDMLRAAVKSRTALGVEARGYLDAGELIPDAIVLQMVGERLDQDDTKTRGFVLDGFPRTVAQAEGLDRLLEPTELDLALNLVVPTELVLGRLASRRVCVDCGSIYSTSARPSIDWICDVCGGEVVQREDDTEAAISTRLDLYDSMTAPLVAWYHQQGKLESISGEDSPDTVFDRIVTVVDAQQREGRFGPHRPGETTGQTRAVQAGTTAGEDAGPDSPRLGDGPAPPRRGEDAAPPRPGQDGEDT